MTAEEAKIIEAADAWFDLINKDASEKQIANRLLSLIGTIAARRVKSAATPESRGWIPYADPVADSPISDAFPYARAGCVLSRLRLRLSRSRHGR